MLFIGWSYKIEDRVTKLVFWSSSREEIKWTMQGTNAAGQGGQRALQNQKRFMLQKSPANRKIRKSWWICWQQKPSLRRITRVVWHPRLKSSAMNLKLQVESQKTKSKNSWKENASVQLRFGSIVWVFAEGGYKHTNPVCGAMKYRTFYVGNLSFPAMGLHQQIRLSLIGSINYN